MNFHPLERQENLHEGYVRTFNAGGCEVVLLQQGGVPAVLEGYCPHAGHPFGNSRIVGTDLRCDMHGYRFNVRTGACTYYTEAPCRALRTYPWQVREGVVGVLL